MPENTVIESVEYEHQVGITIGKLVFSDDDLDASLAEIRPELAVGFGLTEPAEMVLEMVPARVAMAHAIGLVAALQHIRDADDLEGLMISVGFIDENADHEGIAIIKGVALDKALQAAIVHEQLSNNPSADASVERLVAIRLKSRQILLDRGYAAKYFEMTLNVG